MFLTSEPFFRVLSDGYSDVLGGTHFSSYEEIAPSSRFVTPIFSAKFFDDRERGTLIDELFIPRLSLLLIFAPRPLNVLVDGVTLTSSDEAFFPCFLPAVTDVYEITSNHICL